jgi:hypothetical protein
LLEKSFVICSYCWHRGGGGGGDCMNELLILSAEVIQMNEPFGV